MVEDSKHGLNSLRAIVGQALELADAQGNALVGAKLADLLDTIDQQRLNVA